LARAEERVRALEAENGRLKEQVSEARAQLEQASGTGDWCTDYMLDGSTVWDQFVGPRELARSDFAVLSQATGVVFRDGSANPLTLPSAESAVRLLSTTMPLGPGAPPSEHWVDYRLEFVGLGPTQTVVVAKNAAYFAGKVYFRPGLSQWLGTSMHAS